MGLLSSIVSVGKTLVTQPVKSFTEGAKAIAGITANPSVAINKGIMAAEQKVADQGVLVSSIKSVATLGAVAGVVAGGASLLTGGKVAHVAASTIAASPIKSALAGAAGLVGVGVVASNPKAATAAVTNAPSSLVNFGSNVGQFVENPSLLAAEKTLKENPLVSAVVIGAGGVLGAKAATAVANIVTTERNTAALEQMATLNPQIQQIGLKEVTEQPANNTIGSNPQTPQTMEVSKTTTKTPSKRHKKTITRPNNISQRVNVVVAAGNKTYLNKRVLYN